MGEFEDFLVGRQSTKKDPTPRETVAQAMDDATMLGVGIAYLLDHGAPPPSPTQGLQLRLRPSVEYG